MTTEPRGNPAGQILQREEVDPRLREEIAAVTWIFECVRAGESLPVIEAEAVAHSLYVTMRINGLGHVPQVPLREMSEYNAVHAINVALLAMTGAEALHLEEQAVRAVGLAGLLADIGMVRVPIDLLAKTEHLSDDERAIVARHPIDGAAIIAAAETPLDLAAVVAYEHHLRPDGGGYPARIYRRPAHRIARLVAVCDTYHALSSPRPFREAWPADIVASHLKLRSGSDFDSEMVSVVTSMMNPRKPVASHGN